MKKKQTEVAKRSSVAKRLISAPSIYEVQQLSEIHEWEKAKPSVVTSALGVVAKPLGWLTSKVVPKKLIEGAIQMADNVAEYTTDTGDVLRDAQVDAIKELRAKNLELSDKLAHSICRWATAIAASEGGLTGLGGPFGMAADIPVIIILALRTIRKTALCYGYECDTEKEKEYVLGVLSAAGSNTQIEKNATLMALQQLNVMIAKTTWKRMVQKAAENKFGKEAAILSIKAVAKTLGINLTKRLALKIVPVVGSLVGAGVNAAFIYDVAVAAQRCYQRRWLQENGKMKTGE